MTRSLYMLGAVALARTGAAVITAGRTYQLTDSFNYQNFFESFDFFQSDFNTGNYNDVDPTSGYVNYRNESEAEQLQLISTRGTEVYIGVDYNSTLDAQGEGRSSVRLESKQTFDSGLFVAKFSHLPAPVCGTWPSYWMYGSNWPADGEIDIYENWNNAATNLMSLHTGPAADVGACLLVQSEMSDPVVTPNCDNAAVGQYSGQGCGVNEVNGLWGSSTGGICKSYLAAEATEKQGTIHVLTHLFRLQTLWSGPMMPSASGAGPGVVSRPTLMEKALTQAPGARRTSASRAGPATSRTPSATRRSCSTSTSAARRPVNRASGTPSAAPWPTRASSMSPRTPAPSVMSTGRSSPSMSSS